jgi:hypothetical protein
MRRRTFLGLLGALAAGGALGATRVAPAYAAADRLTWWRPAVQPTNPTGGQFVALEWRYLAGRITAGDDDFGFVVSIADGNPPPFLPGDPIPDSNRLLVMRQSFTGGQAHATATYAGRLSYDIPTATYTFVGDNSAVTASWRLDTAAQRYALSVSSPELSLSNLQLAPIGAFFPEGGTGDIATGAFTAEGLPFFSDSDYHADWVALSLAGSPVGVGRLDMQTIRPRLQLTPLSRPFSHHWFALAATLEDGTDAYVSGWQILSGRPTAWAATVATGAGASWQVSSLSSEAGFGGAQPTEVAILAYQPVPMVGGQQRTGQRWRFQAGRAALADTLDLDLAVLPGQFIQEGRITQATRAPMQEAVANSAAGRINGRRITSTRLSVVESTFNEGALRLSLPMLRR